MKCLASNVLRLLTCGAALALASATLAAGSFSTVVIDPGHGGIDRGGIPGQRVAEKSVALDTAIRLQRLLRRAGLHTVMTRSTDVFIPLPRRVAIANALPEAIFVSIHYNASPRQGAHGIETYFEDSRGAALATRIQRQIMRRVSTEDRGIRHATYYVLRKCQKPAVLVECGFLTNPTEAQLALTAGYRQMVAEQIATGILDQRHFAFPSATHHMRPRKHHKSYRVAQKLD